LIKIYVFLVLLMTQEKNKSEWFMNGSTKKEKIQDFSKQKNRKSLNSFHSSISSLEILPFFDHKIVTTGIMESVS
jgi:hypothetical protein